MFVHINEMVGKRFGKLTVIQKAEPNKYGHPMFLCHCDCGKDKEILKSSLTRPTRNAVSCGCKKFESKTRLKSWKIGKTDFKNLQTVLPECTSRLQQRVASIKKNIHSRHKTSSLNDEDIVLMVVDSCSYCGFQDKVNGIGIDRIDSRIGYTKDNSTPCCKTCNFAKNNLTLPEFKQWLERAYRHLVAA